MVVAHFVLAGKEIMDSQMRRAEVWPAPVDDVEHKFYRSVSKHT